LSWDPLADVAELIAQQQQQVGSAIMTERTIDPNLKASFGSMIKHLYTPYEERHFSGNVSLPQSRMI
jgi:hypothetical protein